MALDIAVAFRASGADAVAGQIRRVGQAAEDSQRQVTGSGAAMADQLERVRSGFLQLAGVVGLGTLAAQAVQAADAVTVLRNRLELATGSAQRAAQVYGELYAVAQQSRVSFTELGGVYAQLARAGYASIAVTQAIGNAMAISGGSAQSMQAALVQLGQGMASGTLRGEELNSIMEQTPRLAQAIADGLGVPIGQLRRLGEEGQLTAQRVTEALAIAAPKLAEEVARSTATVSQGFQVLRNSLTVLVGDIDQATGLSAGLAQALIGVGGAADALGRVIRENETAFMVIGGALAGVAVVGGVVALKASLAALIPVIAGVAAALGPVAAAIAAAAAAIGAAVAGWRAWRSSSGGLQNEVARLEGPISIYDQGEERSRAWRDARAAEIRQQMALQGSAGLDTRAEDARFGASAQAYKERQDAMAGVLALQRELDGSDAQYAKRIAVLAEALRTGAISLDEYQRHAGIAYRQSKAGKDAASAWSAEAQKQAQVLADLSGLSATWAEDVTRLGQMVGAGRISQEQYNDALQRLIDKQPAIQALRAEEQRYQAAVAKTFADATKASDDLQKQVQAQLDANLAAKEGADALKVLEIARLRETASMAARRAFVIAERTGNNDLAAVYLAQAQAMRDLADAREAGMGIEADRRAAESSKRLLAEQSRAAADLERTLTDALMRAFEAGKGFAEAFRDTIVNYFNTMVLRPVVQAVVQAVVQPVIGGASRFLGFSAPGGASMGNPLAGVQNIASTVGYAAGSVGSFLGNASGAAYGTNIGSQQSMMLAQQEMGMGATNAWGSAAQTGANYIMGAAVGHYGGRAISNGYSVGGGSGNTAVNLGTAIGAIWSPIGAAIGGMIGGLTNRLFGRKLEDYGVEGSFSSSGFAGSQYQFFEGGMFRSDDTRRSNLDAALGDVLSAGAKAVTAQVREYSKAVGLPAEAVEGFSQGMRVSLKGLSQEEAQVAILKEVEQFQAGMIAVYRSQLEPLQRAGETLGQTLERLVGLQTFSRNLSELGTVFARVANLSVDAREQMIALAGGMDQFAANAMGFVQNYYSRDEIAGLKARELQGVLGSLGITQDFLGADAASQFRRLVEGTDVGSEAGMRQLATLMGVQGDFAQVAQYLSETGLSLSGAAGQAPEAGSLQSIFQDSSNRQVNAIRTMGEAIVTAVNGVREAIRERYGEGGDMQSVVGGWTTPDEIVIPESTGGL